MVDVFGKELNVGDKVAFVSTWYDDKFKRIDEGIIEKISDHFVFITNMKYGYGKTRRKNNRIIKL